MNKLNICIICDSIDMIGGSQVSAKEFAQKLAIKGHNIIIITSKLLDLNNISLISKCKNIKIYQLLSLPKIGAQDLKLTIPNKKTLKTIFSNEKIDILYTILPTYMTNRAISIGKNMKIPIVSHSHVQSEMVLLQSPFIFRNEFSKNILNKLLKYIYTKTNAIIFPTQFALKSLNIKKKIPQYVISNGIDTNNFHPLEKKKYQYLYSKYGLSKEKYQILYLGRLEEEKNVEILIDAINVIVHKKNVQNINLIVAGGGNQFKNLQSKVENNNLKDYVKFTNKVPQEDVIPIYNLCDIFVLPSILELEGIVVLEAMACGKPIIISNAPQSASVQFVNNNGYSFQYNDKYDLSNKILRIIQDPTLKQKFNNNSIIESKKYDINKSVDKLENIFYEVINKYNKK